MTASAGMSKQLGDRGTSGGISQGEWDLRGMVYLVGLREFI